MLQDVRLKWSQAKGLQAVAHQGHCALNGSKHGPVPGPRQRAPDNPDISDGQQPLPSRQRGGAPALVLLFLVVGALPGSQGHGQDQGC